MIENAGLLINVTGFKKADIFNEELSLLKMNKKGPNTTYDLRFVYTDNKREENYKCVIQSFNENHDRTNAPTRTIVFTLAD